jgi:uncharacterized membrane protein YesL
MGIAFGVLWAALKDYYEEMFTLVGANLLWVLLAIPVITLPPATAGMFYLTNHIARHKSIEFRMFFEGFRKYLWKSYALTLLNLAAAVLFWVNLHFYGSQFGDQQWAVIVRGLFVGLAVMWCLIQIYVFPMLLEQEEPRLLLALRNAAFLTFASPITSLTLAVLMVVVAALSVGLTLPFAVAMMAVLCLMANGAVLRLLVHFKIRQPPEELAGT